MNARDFFNLVVKMRNAQTTLIKYPYPHLKEEAAKLEALVDAEIERVDKVLKEQTKSQQQKLL